MSAFHLLALLHFNSFIVLHFHSSPPPPVFGIGSLIYSGIEVGCQVEWHLQAPACSDLLLALRPTLHILLVLLQTYFLFLNHRMNLYKRKAVSRLGLMHLAATNLCLWLKELLQEVQKAQVPAPSMWGLLIPTFVFRSRRSP